MCLYQTRIDGNHTMQTSYFVCSICRLTRSEVCFSTKVPVKPEGTNSDSAFCWATWAQFGLKQPVQGNLHRSYWCSKLVLWELNPFDTSYVNYVFLDLLQSAFSLNIRLVIISSSACWQIIDWSVEIASEKISYTSQPTTNKPSGNRC